MAKKIKKEDRERIVKTLATCEEVQKSFFATLTKWSSDDENHGKLVKDYISQYTYMAGEGLRKILKTGRTASLNYYFYSMDNVLEFKDLLKRKNHPLFGEYTDGDQYLSIPKGPSIIRFDTENASPPDHLLGLFSFSCNRHYFIPKTYEMSFNMGAFQNWSAADNIGIEYSSPQEGLRKLIEVTSEGFTFGEPVLTQFVEQLLQNQGAKYNRQFLIHELSSDIPKHLPSSVYEQYTTEDFFFKEEEHRPTSWETRYAYYGTSSGISSLNSEPDYTAHQLEALRQSQAQAVAASQSAVPSSLQTLRDELDGIARASYPNGLGLR